MLHTKKVKTDVVTGFTCDRCGKVQSADGLDFQEGHHIAFTGGYSSVFGDGTRVQADLCQDCLKELIGGFCRATPHPL